MNAVEQYNSLVEEWNDRYGHLTTAMHIEAAPDNSISSRVQNTFTSETSPRRKLVLTKQTISDYAGLTQVPPADDKQLSRTELALLVVQAAETLLSE